MKNKKILTIILILIWMCIVFKFSSQPSTESSQLSGGITKAILNFFNVLEGKTIEQQSQIETIVRKLAHYSIYTIGGILIILHVNLYKISANKKVIVSQLIGTLYAATDEIHQLFVPGRSGEIRDVCLDSLGVITGIVIILIILKYRGKAPCLPNRKKEVRVENKKIYFFFKRLIDIILSLIGLIILIPFFIIFAIIIKCESKGPVFFKQKRFGKNKKFFMIYKFRTMRNDTPKDMPTHMLNNAESYITKFGGFMRKTSIDELPQIINILKGDMSIIGPRPALWNQDNLIEERDKYKANDVRPGLTGLAQISGRDELEIPVKAKFDGEYIEKMSLWFDIKISFTTILKVFKHDGVVEGKQQDDKNLEKEEIKEESEVS